MVRRWDGLRERYDDFLEARDWHQFHTPQNLAMAISVEANELLELFLWFDNPDTERVVEDEELVNKIRDEVADILIYCLSLAIQMDIDLREAVEEKMEKNESRFDEETVREVNEELERWQES